MRAITWSISSANRSIAFCGVKAPEFTSPFYQLGIMYAAQKKFPESEKRLREVIKENDKNIGAHVLLGMVINSQVRIDEANKEYRKVLSISPKHALAANNLAANLSDHGGNLDEALSFRPFAPEDTDLETFEILTRALKERRVLKFQYRNLGAEKAQGRLVHPYHLACVDNHWYLFAFDVKRQAMRTFALPRLKSPEITAERFTIPKKFNLNEYLKGSLTVFKGDDDYEIVVEFDSWAADLVRGRNAHHIAETLFKATARALAMAVALAGAPLLAAHRGRLSAEHQRRRAPFEDQHQHFHERK